MNCFFEIFFENCDLISDFYFIEKVFIAFIDLIEVAEAFKVYPIFFN
jgi:hypothetical protein